MRAEFSEFTFGFSLVSELAHLLRCRAVPIFPSLIMEGSEGGGYDVKMSMGAVPLYLQFKLSEHLKTNRAKEAKRAPELLQAPYRRFAITSSEISKQHEMLIGLNQRHAHVFYCAPDFYTNEALNQAWVSGSVSDNTLYVRPVDIGAFEDGLKHTVCFNTRAFLDGTCYVFSKPRPVAVARFDQMREQLAASLALAKTPLRDVLPKWIEDLTAARVEGQRLHGIRRAAIEQKRLEDRRAKDDTEELDGLETRAFYRPTIETFVTEPARPTPLRPRSLPRSDDDRDRADLTEFGRQIARDFHAQVFILQANS